MDGNSYWMGTGGYNGNYIYEKEINLLKYLPNRYTIVPDKFNSRGACRQAERK